MNRLIHTIKLHPVWIIGVLLFININSVSAQTWDTASGTPPSTKTAEPIPEPVKIEPFYLLVYNDCQSGKPVVDIVSEYGFVGFVPVYNGDSIIINLKTHDKRERRSSLHFHGKAFYLKIILGRDTALYRIDAAPEIIRTECLKEAKLLSILKVRELPDNIIQVQFTGNESKKDIRQFLKDFESLFDGPARIRTLEEGFYRCLPAPRVSVAGLGRKKSVNKTDLGYLVAVELLKPEAISKIETWLSERKNIFKGLLVSDQGSIFRETE